MRRTVIWMSSLILTLSAAGSTGARARTDEPCCFTNPGFSGTCKVQPGEGETCASILQYLNTPNSQGRTYCGGTNIRGGWESVTCEE